MSDGSAPLVRTERAGPVLRVVLDSPSNANALSRRLVAELMAALCGPGAHPDVRAVVLSASGTTFCAGADLAERLRPPPDPAPVGIPEVLSSIVSLPVPVVARVHGHVRGGGMGLLAACDLAVAGESATFAFSEVRVGVAPAIIAVCVLRRMARRSFERFALTGDVFGAAEAAASGLVNAVVADADLDDWVDAVLRSILRSAPRALAATKTLPDLSARPWDDAMTDARAISDALFASAEGAEGMAAFLARRRPAWEVVWPPAAGG